MRVLLFFLILVSLNSHSGGWSEVYTNQVVLIEKAMSQSKKEGFNVASFYNSSCSFHIYEIHYEKAVQKNFKEFYSKRFYNWRKSNKELHKKIDGFLEIKDMEQAAFHARERFKINCTYLKNLRKEFRQKNNWGRSN